MVCLLSILLIALWGRRDLNPHALRHMILSHACLPIPARPRAGEVHCSMWKCGGIIKQGEGCVNKAQKTLIHHLHGVFCIAEGFFIFYRKDAVNRE